MTCLGLRAESANGVPSCTGMKAFPMMTTCLRSGHLGSTFPARVDQRGAMKKRLLHPGQGGMLSWVAQCNAIDNGYSTRATEAHCAGRCAGRCGLRMGGSTPSASFW